MSTAQPSPRRVKEERGIYRSSSGSLEVYYTDPASGNVRFKKVDRPATMSDAAYLKAARGVAEGYRVAARNGDTAALPAKAIKFREAAEQWTVNYVVDLAPKTRANYRDNLAHSLGRWGNRKLDAISTDDVAKMVRDMRAPDPRRSRCRDGYSESEIDAAVKRARQVFDYADKSLGWHRPNPVARLSKHQRPKPGQAKAKRAYSDAELSATAAALPVSWRAPFWLAATTGLRAGELLGLKWTDLHLDEAEGDGGPWLGVAEQVDRHGERAALKTDTAVREVGIPADVVTMLHAHKLHQPHGVTGPADYVFATATGKPRSRRNLLRALDTAQRRAVTPTGALLYPDAGGKSRRAAGLPNVHELRHTAATRALADGDSADEVAWMLGHKDARVTRAVYLHEVTSAENRARRVAAATRRFGKSLASGADPQEPSAVSAPVVPAEVLSQIRAARG